MRALVYEKAHELKDFALQVAEISEPDFRETVLVEVHAIGVNPGEAFIRCARSASTGARILMGWEFAGVVLATGKATQRFKIGRRVYGSGDMARDGCWAQRVAVDYRILAHIPDQLHSRMPPVCLSVR